MIKLVIQDDEGKTTVVPLIKDEITVGRKEGNTIRLTERNVSRRHARFLRNNGTIEIEDLNSYNGVKVNGNRIQGRTGLGPSDRIQIGDYLIELKADGAGAMGGGGIEDQATKPIPTVHPSQPLPPGPIVAASGTALPQTPADEAQTTKVPSPVTTFPPGSITNTSTSPGGQAAEAYADTDPGRAVPVTTQPEIVAAPSDVGRLVILSSTFAGREYELNRATLVIGRTDDNDIVVNHRSISRHHAKIVRENGRYSIHDLQSSNGVRVNGEEYGKVELRRGDIIDLGHVRLRFVEPGEDFLFGRDAQAVPIPGSAGKGLIYGLVAALLIISAVAIWAFTHGDSTESGQATPGQSGDETITQTTGGPEGTTPTEVPKAAADKIAPLLEAAQDAIGAEKWDDAIEAAKEAKKLDPGNETAEQRLDKARREKTNRTHFKRFKRLVKQGKAADALRTYKDIEDDSVYKDRSREDYDTMGAKYAKQATVRANALSRDKKCDDVGAVAAEATTLWGDGDLPGTLRKIESSCRVQLAQASKPKTTKREPEKETNDRTDSGSGNGGDNKETKKEREKDDPPYDELMAKADKEGFRGNYAAAFRACNLAYRQKPSGSLAYKCGYFACRGKVTRSAKRYYRLVPKGKKSSLEGACLQYGVSVKSQ